MSVTMGFAGYVGVVLGFWPVVVVESAFHRHRPGRHPVGRYSGAFIRCGWGPGLTGLPRACLHLSGIVYDDAVAVSESPYYLED